MAKLRAGLVGLGMMGRNHARVLASLEGVDLIAMADPASKVELAGDAELLSGVNELLARNLDYVVVAAPTAAHSEITEACAARGVHVLVEKPLTTDVEEAQRLKVVFKMLA